MYCDGMEEVGELPMMTKTISTIQSKWMKLLKEGGCIKRLWVPTVQGTRREMLPFDVWFTLREFILSTLKGRLQSNI